MATFFFLLPSLEKTWADTVSIYFPPALNASTGITTSTGGSLAGFTVRAGIFTNTPSQLLANLAGQTSAANIRSTIHASFTQYGSFSMPDLLNDPDQAVFTIEDPIVPALRGQDLYLLFYNDASFNNATEMGIFRMATRANVPGQGVGVFPTLDDGFGSRGSEFYFSDVDTLVGPESFLNLLVGQYNPTAGSFTLGALAGGIGQIFNEDKSFAVGSAFSELILNNFGANSFSAPALPAGLSLNPTTGLITGTFAAGTFTITASNTLTGASASKTLTYTASLQAPVITGIVPDEATFGSAATNTIQINNGATAVSVSGLPGGLTHAGGASLIISGTPTVAGNFNLVITASNAAGSDTQTIPLTVLPGTAPVISYAGTTNNSGTIVATNNQTYSNSLDTNLHLYKFKTSLDEDEVLIRRPISYTLPANVAADLNNIGLFLNPTNGVLFGTPAVRTNLTLPVTISNAAIGATTNFILDVKYAEPQLASTTGTATVGKPINIPLVFTEQSRVTSLQLTTVPPSLQGMVVLNANQLTNATLSGTFTGATNIPQTLILTAGNEDATNSNLRFTLVLEADTSKPNLTSATTVAGKVGQALSLQLTADNNPTSFAQTGLPAGLSLNTATGLVSGVPTEEGTFAVSFSAANGNGTGPAQTVSFTIDLDPPSIPSPLEAVGKVGDAFSFPVTASPNPTAFQISSGTLPTGLTLAQDTGVISGTPTVSGNFVVGIQARNSKGLGAASSLTLSIAGIPPVITSALTATGNAEQFFSYQITADNAPLTSFAASGLPAGLSINTATGVISGIPTAGAGTYTITFSAANAAGTATANLTLILNAAPQITSSLTATATRGSAFSYQITADSSPTSYDADGLPAGLSVNKTTGLISGTPTVAAGTFTVTLSAANLTGERTANLILTLNAAPQITSDPAATAIQGAAFAYQITADSSPTSYNATDLPAGLSINTSTGLISGTPTAAAGTYVITLYAKNAIDTGTENLTLILNATPQITSALTATATRGVAFAYQITADNSATSYDAIGLPAGVSVNTTNGLISGTPTVAAGTFTVTLSAKNAAGTGTAILTLTLNAIPQISSPLTTPATRGAAFAYQITADSSPTSYNATDLPAGLSINTSTGLISGTPTAAAGTYVITLSATNATEATGSAQLILNLSDPILGAPVISSSQIATATSGLAFSYQIIADNSPTSYDATGLPAGLSVNTSTGLISGTPTVAAGTFTVTLSAANASGTGTANLILTLNAAPQITSSLTTTAIRGVAFAYQITADSSPTSYNATGLPAGLSINTSTGLISGTPTDAADTYTITLSAANASGTGTANLTLILNAAPQITSSLAATATRGSAFSYQITADSSPTSYNATGLPAGLSVNTTNGLISGTPNIAAGTFTITLSAANATGTGTANLTLILNAAPQITSSLAVTATRGSAFAYQITADSFPTSYNATGLPAGLSINTTNGLISGTPTVAAATFTVTLSAANATGTGTANLILTLNAAPQITSALTATAIRGMAFAYQITADSFPTSYNATGLPTGLSVNTSTGLISGTPTAAKGTFPITLSAANATGTRTANLTLILIVAPQITSALSAAGIAERPFEYQIIARNDPTSFAASGLPAGLSINSATGVISGTPEATFTGDVTITANNAAGGDSRTLRLVINPAVVIITSTNVTGTVGTPFSFPLVANPANDVIFSEGGERLPTGVTINTDGLIQGTPLSAGSTAVNLKAERRGVVTEDSRYTRVNFSFTNPPFFAPDADRNGVLTFQAGVPGRSILSAPAGFALSLVEAEGLPDGLRWDGTALTGTPTTGTRIGATNTIQLTATLTTDRGTATISTNFIVRVSGTPASLELPEEIEVEVGKGTGIPISFGGTEALVTASGLPPGLILSGGILSGTNSSTNGPAEWKATITADNARLTGGTNVSRAVTIRLRNPVPVMTGNSRIITSQGRSAGLNLSFDATVENLRLRNLPPGVEISGNRITVPANLAPGKYTLQVESENRLRPGDATSLLQTALADVRIFVDQGAPPAATLAAIPSGLTVSAGSFTEQTLISPDAGVRVSATGLPAGLTLDPETGKLSGTVAQRGTYRLTLFVQNGKRWVKKTVTVKAK